LIFAKMEEDQPSFPEPHVIPPTASHTHTVVLLHGRGSSGQEFAEELFEGESLSEQTLPRHFPGFKWVFPTAHPCYSTIFDEDLVEWFDIYSLADPGLEEELQIEGLAESVAFVQTLLVKEAQILGWSASDRVVLGGISQGCAVAVTALLTGTCRMGAFLGFNGWMPLMDRVKKAVSETSGGHDASSRKKFERIAVALNSRLGFGGGGYRHPLEGMLDNAADVPQAGHLHTPSFLSHTADDEIIDIVLGKQMRDTLGSTGLHAVVWKEYESGGHWIPEPEGFEDVVEFLSEVARAQAK
jgi:lysophospholipase II